MSRDRVYELLAGEPERVRPGGEISRSRGIRRAAWGRGGGSLRRGGRGEALRRSPARKFAKMDFAG